MKKVKITISLTDYLYNKLYYDNVKFSNLISAYCYKFFSDLDKGKGNLYIEGYNNNNNDYLRKTRSISIDDELYQRLKFYSFKTNRSISNLIETILLVYLSKLDRLD